MRADDALRAATSRFIDEVGAAMEAIANRVPSVDAAQVRADVAIEARHLAAGFIDSDGLETDDELWAYIATFALLDQPSLAHAQPRDVRRAGMISGRRAWLATPSPLFEILVGVDARDRSRHATTYYERAMEIGHTVASLDDHVSRTELLAIEQFRTMLLGAISRAHAPHPGRPDDDAPPAPGVDDRSTGPSPGAAPATSEASPTAAGPDAEPAAEELPPARPVEELLAELEDLIGLEDVKREVKLVTNLLRVQKLRKERGLPSLDTTRHLVFTGNPGTGKTTVARLLAEIYRSLEVVAKGHLVETDRAGLVAGYVGQTATKVHEVFDRADQGVLLIDEAYSLVRGGENDFGREAIDTIVKEMEDRRETIVVIVAGYPDEMGHFLDANPGLRSRFPKSIEFPDYTTDELIAIFELQADKTRYALTDEAREAVRAWFDAQHRGKGFGNGRLARNLFEDAVGRHASRIVAIESPSDDELVALTPADIPAVDEGPRHQPSADDLLAGLLDDPDGAPA